MPVTLASPLTTRSVVPPPTSTFPKVDIPLTESAVPTKLSGKTAS